MQKINLDLGDNSYSIFIDYNFLDEIPIMINTMFSYKRVTIITDENVNRLYLKRVKTAFIRIGIACHTFSVLPGEASKSLEVLSKVYDALIDNQMTRSDAVIALGGGVIGDLAGYAAATYLRGIDFIQIPTTLLSQVDSSVGGKVAVNLPQGKNLVGNFYQPKAVFIDTKVLETLDEREVISGMAEVIKYGCIRDKALFELLEGHDLKTIFTIMNDIIMKCVQTKADIVEIDEKESGERMLLNFGHTVGHAIEKYYDYKKYNHGEAVGQGISYIINASIKENILNKDTHTRITNVLKQYGLFYEEVYPMDVLLEHMKKDKKSIGDEINIILVDDIGSAFIKRVTFDYLNRFLMEGIC